MVIPRTARHSEARLACVERQPDGAASRRPSSVEGAGCAGSRRHVRTECWANIYLRKQSLKRNAADRKFLVELGIRESVIDVIDPLILAKLKSSERYKDAFAKLHKLLSGLDDFPLS